ncbi:hypothetical protein P154DRAFT_538004 [Amniculicola lignicola CBS 123094]|uniref:Uncharacterized protein n=1 Tax=Amniculicola lignicola CBS 123094 TaxID=1392246 RepID=A0A6A5W5Z8_9PLEO|nr:hypothetical protein P154DRAFT_538004 [Amniculicola lignicola CBS 123094]
MLPAAVYEKPVSLRSYLDSNITSFPFLDLASELRIKIYGLIALQRADPLSAYSGLLLTCKAIHGEASYEIIKQMRGFLAGLESLNRHNPSSIIIEKPTTLRQCARVRISIPMSSFCQNPLNEFNHRFENFGVLHLQTLTFDVYQDRPLPDNFTVPTGRLCAAVVGFCKFLNNTMQLPSAGRSSLAQLQWLTMTRSPRHSADPYARRGGILRAKEMKFNWESLLAYDDSLRIITNTPGALLSGRNGEYNFYVDRRLGTGGRLGKIDIEAVWTSIPFKGPPYQ